MNIMAGIVGQVHHASTRYLGTDKGQERTRPDKTPFYTIRTPSPRRRIGFEPPPITVSYVDTSEYG